jgi:hypothetical protein
VEEEPQPVVVQIAKAMGDPEHLLDQVIDGLGGPVGRTGAVVGEDLRTPPGMVLARRCNSGTEENLASRTKASKRRAASTMVSAAQL